MRSALSRSYYSIYHAAKALFGKVDHHDIGERLAGIDPELQAKVEKLKQLRSQADYDPKFVEKEYGGSLEKFQVDARKSVDEGLTVFNRIIGEIERNSRS